MLTFRSRMKLKINNVILHNYATVLREIVTENALVFMTSMLVANDFHTNRVIIVIFHLLIFSKIRDL